MWSMDKFVVIGGLMGFMADLLAIAAIATPKWVVTEFSGFIHLGLIVMCQKSPRQPEVCVSTDLPGEWKATLVFLLFGVVSLTLSSLLIVISFWKPYVMSPARWIAFLAMTFFCFAALIFPLGFYMPEIGGEAFKLPSGTNVGTSFFLFICCIVLTIASELFTFKVCPLLLR